MLTPHPTPRAGRGSGEEALFFQPVVEVRDELAITIPFDGRYALIGPEHAFRRLAPARVRDIGIDVCPEAVLVTLHGFPKGYRLLFGERETHDRLDGFEAVFPRQRQPQRCPVLLRNGFAVHAGHEKRELVAGLGDRDALNIGPRIPEFLLA